LTSTGARKQIADFDVAALFEALDSEREARGLSWSGVAQSIWALSSELNCRTDSHPISSSTLRGMPRRGATSCQHALFMLRWLGRSPESFLEGAAPDNGPPMPAAGTDKRLRWSLRRLHQALEESRAERGMTWSEVATELRCTPNQLTGLRTARFATSIKIAMRIVQWVGRPSSDFIYPADW
jgi:hypothetical protein